MMPDRLIPALNGRRGAFLVMGGISYALIGLSYVTTTTAGRDAAFQWLPESLTPDRLGWLWVVGGAVALLSALLTKVVRRAEMVGFSVLMACPLLWSVIFIGAFITGAHPLGWVSAVTYGTWSVWIGIAASWDNPRPQKTP